MTEYKLNTFIISIDEDDIELNYDKQFQTFFIINQSLRTYLLSIKQEIDKYSDKWDIYKKILNKYEYINTSVYLDRFKSHTSICTYKPISRSYFKLIEILNHFQFDFSKESIKSFHLAEGPGGFIEALVNHRNNKNDQYYGMTLIDSNKDIPSWNRIQNFKKAQKYIYRIWTK